MAKTDPVTELIKQVDDRIQQMLPVVGLTWCWMEFTGGRYWAHVDTGQVIPGPAIWGSITATGSSTRYPCFWFQGGHDVLVLGEPASVGVG